MAIILIVDDRAANRLFLGTLLRAHGHRVLEAADAAAALAAVRAEPPALVITDVLMPVMDGYEFVQQLRLDPAIGVIPVVFYTAIYGEREARALALSIGVSYVLAKPAEPADVLKIVDHVLSGESETGGAPYASPLPMAFERQHLRLLTDTVSAKNSDLRTSNARLRALINIGLELASERDADRLLQRVCVAARDLFGATYVTLGIIDLSNRTVQRVVSCGTAAGWIKTGDAISGILGTVVGERRTVRGDNPGGDPIALKLPALHPEVQTFLAAPLASPAHVHGWICFVGNEGRAFTDDDEDLVTALSGQIGRIYENSYFATVAQKRSDELEHEIVERQQAESALRHERDRAQRYLDAAEVILLALDLDGRITLINRKGCDVLGWTEAELLGRCWIETCLPERAREAGGPLLQRLLTGNQPVGENLVLTKSGEERLIEWRNTVLRDDAGRIVGALSSGADITQGRALEAQYQQAQKMEAVGRLAGGVAHDFNNLLTAILGYCELLLDDLGADDRCRADVAEIQRAGGSAAALTRQLLAFSRKEIIEPKLFDLNLVVNSMQGMLARLIRDDVKVTLKLLPEGAMVKADHGQVEQIVMNLAVNARDAMPGGGTLTIETADIELDEHYAKTHPSVAPGPYIALTVTDTGTGMTPQVLARLFEPFFTTKDPGKGTGLGLATVHGIVARSGGSVDVYSEVGIGTAFHIYFPRADASEIVADEPAPVVRVHTGTQTVLVVDDADGLRGLAKRLLERQGYKVLIAANTEEAIRVFDANAAIEVLLTDVVMAGGSGPDLARQLVERRPALKVIYMSGYTEDTIVHHGVLKPGIAFIQKPFTSDMLGRKLRDVLHR